MKTSHPKFIVGIGGSAGGLYAYSALLDALPSDTGMAFVIVSHILPTANTLLAQLLSSHTKMPVMVASEAMPILANHVYVNPPNTDLRIKKYAFEVASPRTMNKTVDIFLNSLAEAMGDRAIGVILSGYDSDGTEGSRHIKARGGTIFAQDMSAKVGEMPYSAEISGSVDFILSPAKISHELQKLARASIKEGVLSL